MEQEYEDSKWAFEHMLELLEEYHPDYDTDSVIEDCIKIYRYYYD